MRLSLIASLLLISTAAQAEGLYVEGGSLARRYDLTVPGATTTGDSAKGHALSGALRLGYELDDRWAVEAGYVSHGLLDNALRYVPAGGRIEVALRAVGAGLELRVADDGPGLPPEWRERAFDRFWRAPGQAVSGSGLGLAIVRQAAFQLGGCMRIDDGLGGRGIAFVLVLPKTA